MELMIEVPQLPQIAWNHEAIKEAALAKASEYRGIIYQDSDEAIAKRDRADINKIIKALEEERKRIKAVWMAPYLAFEAKEKEVLVPLQEAVREIDVSIKRCDEQYRAEKAALMQDLYESLFGDLRDILPFGKIPTKEYYKKEYTEKKLTAAFEALAAKARQDADALMAIDPKFQARCIETYQESLDLGKALAEAARLQRLDEELEARRKAEEERRRELQRQKEERERQLEEERKMMEARRAAEAAEAASVVPPEEIPAPSPARPSEGFLRDLGAIQEEPLIEYGPIYFKGTKQQLLGLAAYMREHGIQFRKGA